MDVDTICKVNARCFGRDSSGRDSSGRRREPVSRSLTPLRMFIDSVIDVNNPDFVCSCCIETAGVLDSAPESVFLIACSPENIAKRYAGCRYDASRGLFLANIDGSPIVIRVAGRNGFLYSTLFARKAIANVCYTSRGVPVMSTVDFVAASLHAKYNMHSAYDDYFAQQHAQQQSALLHVHFKRECGYTSNSNWSV